MIKSILKITVIMLGCFLMTACREDTNISLSDDAAVSTTNQERMETSYAETSTDKVVVYVNGAVKNPGVYILKSGDRIYQAIDMAGGMTSKAKKDVLNLAETVVDAQNVYVMTKKEYKSSQTESAGMKKEQENESDSDLVNINTADKERLTTLPGVGEVKAAAVIAYREENGLFSSKEDIKNVSGIGDATYANIEDLITVK